MKIIYFSLVLLLGTINATFASDISTTCSSASGYIKWEENSHWEGVRIVTDVDWSTKAETVQRIPADVLEVEFTLEEEIAQEDIGTLSHQYKRAKLTLRPLLEGARFPNAYDKSVKPDGSLSDYVICRTTISSMPK
jgi:hypothetical protein